ncbi:MAG: 2-oxoacid:acceptor oxidoreductase subunit alpha [Chloroflexi bacterium]|nr:2-oxoacid:acceptor oxidoreductase subunit alpha [Chloroflexota bacterium]
MGDSVQTAERAAPSPATATRINDFQMIVATINGTGSQTSNTAILRALFKMGIPVNGKNIFPSNIQGLPTWFTIRVSKDGYTARRETNEILVAMNPNTAVEDAQQLPSGGICLYDEVFVTDQRYRGFGFEESRDDISYHRLPIDALLKEVDVPKALQDRVRNMVYVGALAHLIGITLESLEEALIHHFKGKEKPVALNMNAIKAAHAWAQENLQTASPYRVEAMNETEGMILIDGNSAGALGAVYGGMTFLAWYPITPSTSLADAATAYANHLRVDENGRKNFAIVQAEDELAAIGMVLGAGWAGARAFTCTSGPGISLMSEFAGMAYFAEIPSVIWDVQRMGPSTGLPTRTSQGDLMSAYLLGHGDTHHVVLMPNDPKEAFEFGWRAFDLADELQTLVFVLSDLDLGMNQWMSDPFDYPDEPMKRGKVLSAEDLEERNGKWYRFVDEDGDGVGYRTLPGTEHWNAAYFARGTGHNKYAVYSERADDWVENLERLRRKFDTARTLVPKPIVHGKKGNPIGIIAYGTSDTAVLEARDYLAEAEIDTCYLRLRALPIEETTRAFIEEHERIYVVENNYDGQLANILRMELPEYATRFITMAHADGWPLTANWITETLKQHEAAQKN